MTSYELQMADRGKFKIQDLSPSDILPFVDHINNLQNDGWLMSLCPMHDKTVWHVLFCHSESKNKGKPCYAHGYGEALRDAMKSAIATALDKSQWPYIYKP